MRIVAPLLALFTASSLSSSLPRRGVDIGSMSLATGLHFGPMDPMLSKRFDVGVAVSRW